jgi:hypothetical protein
MIGLEIYAFIVAGKADVCPPTSLASSSFSIVVFGYLSSFTTNLTSTLIL